MSRFIKNLKKYIKYIYYSFLYVFRKPQIKIFNDEETIKKINDGYSISRFGDGEFRWMLGVDDTPRFQEKNEKLSLDLKEVINSNEENLLLCIPENMVNMNNKTIDSKLFWKKFVCTYWNQIKTYINKNEKYGNTNLTRFYMDYKDKKNCKNKIENIINVWSKKNVLIVEGCQTKLGVGNDLFNNCSKIYRIECPATNAYAKINDITKAIQTICSNKTIDMVILALGPTATIISYKLTKLGIQALDVGHIDIEYEWMLMGAAEKTGIKGKYVNEIGGVLEKEEKNDKKYESEIIEIIN